MLTVFSTPKPFIGHSNIVQRNALKSWTLLHPDAEVILFGDEEGAAEACRDLGIRHEPQVRRNEHGTKYLNYLFDRARDMSRHEYFCYANCDIMLTGDFLEGLELVSRAHSSFLMVGRRWDTDITEPWDFSQPDWAWQLRSLALLKVIGRNGWDPWLTWHARKSKARLIDASRMVVAVHQNHDYAYLRQGAAFLHSDAEASYNWSLGVDAAWHYYTVDAATDKLLRGHLRANRLAWLGPIKSRVIHSFSWIWGSFLKATRRIRHRLGLRRHFLANKT